MKWDLLRSPMFLLLIAIAVIASAFTLIPDVASDGEAATDSVLAVSQYLAAPVAGVVTDTGAPGVVVPIALVMVPVAALVVFRRSRRPVLTASAPTTADDETELGTLRYSLTDGSDIDSIRPVILKGYGAAGIGAAA